MLRARMLHGFLFLLMSLLASSPAAGQPPQTPKTPALKKARSPREADRPLVEKLRSPRETLKTLYYAILTYDRFPDMIDDAIACLDLDSRGGKASIEEATFLALEMEFILQGLDLPLNSVPDACDKDAFVLMETEGIPIKQRRCADGCWRFDADTLGRVSALSKLVRDRRKKVDQERAGLREEFSDPRTTLRRFMRDAIQGDYYAASRALDLSSRSTEERLSQGPLLAQQLAFVIQHRGYLFWQEVPATSSGPAYTWHADRNGRIVLDRLRQPDGKDAWLFSRQTVTNIGRMFAAMQSMSANDRYVRLDLVIPEPKVAAATTAGNKRPDDVPAHLGSPRAVLKGFFRTMDAADANDAKLASALEFLDLQSLPLSDRGTLGGKLATKLETVLRKAHIDLTAVPDNWNAPPQVLGENQGFRIEVARQRDGCWRFSESTINRVPEMFDKLAGKDRSDRERTSQLESARDTMINFLSAIGHHDYALAARCLNLQELHPSAQDELGPVLACKLKYVLDRLGRIYVQEIPDEPSGPRYVVYRGDLGRIVIHRKADDPGKGQWFFTPETVERIEPMFRAVLHEPVDASNAGEVGLSQAALLEQAPGVWLRLRLPTWMQRQAGQLDLYQWFGFALAAFVSWALAYISLRQFQGLVGWTLHKSGSALSSEFVSEKLRPLTWLAAFWLLFQLLGALDLPFTVANAVLPLKKFVLAALVGWLGLRLIDLTMGIYTNSELLRPHRSLSDLVVPVSMRLIKAGVTLLVLTYVIYQVGQGDLLARFLTGLGVAGLAASLAAQDAMKSFFGTLLLISERAFKIGDKIVVNGQEGVVEQVGFRSTRLRTPEDSLLTIPNSNIAAASIDNMGARSQRRFRTTVLVGHDTPVDRLLLLRDQLLQWLAQQSKINQEKVEVYIHRVVDAGIELNVSLFLMTMDGSEEWQLREAINCQLLRLSSELDVNIAPIRRLASTEAVLQVFERKKSA